MSIQFRRQVIFLGVMLMAWAALFVSVSGDSLAKTRIVFWSNHRLEDEPTIQQLIRQFEESHPEIEIDWQNQVDGGNVDYYDVLTVAILGGAAPDVFYVRPGTDVDFVMNGWIYDIDSFVRRDADELQLDDFIPAQVSELQHEGKWWALPFDFSAIGLYYNQEMFDAAGVSYPTSDWTWDDLADAARSLTRSSGDRVTQWGITGLNWMFSQWAEGIVMSFGGRLFDESYSQSVAATETGTVAALELPVRLMHEMQVAPQFDTPNYGGLFSGGQSAMTLDGSWATTTHRQFNEFRFDVSSLPWGPAGLTVSATGGGWAMSADTQAPEAAWEWMKAIASHEASRKLIVEPVRSLPPRISLMGEWAREIEYAGAPASAERLANQVVQYGRAIPRVGFAYHGVLQSYRDLLARGEISALEAVEQIDREFQVEFQRLKSSE